MFGLLFTPSDRDALEQAIARVAELKDTVFGAAALDRARAYPPEAMAADFVALAESVLAKMADDDPMARASESPNSP